MSTKRPNEGTSAALVPVAKKSKNEVIAYAARYNRVGFILSINV